MKNDMKNKISLNCNGIILISLFILLYMPRIFYNYNSNIKSNNSNKFTCVYA